eukprot:gnl/MRDRNA2_/MRDRNA2_107360_c0_seq1.p1 gnl/MRDRNA2_/MRDRNA2_107360_c0~~gnl/MRDRNA2_/MRDRNA2_107360_c0_seq1.p1  ORF type:complete len:199 (-),score=29.74 gnl/MRDRNA2_/MRDRNA2_107360_c0_seq1:121-717(-)
MHVPESMMFPIQLGPPTDMCLQSRPWIRSFVVLQTITCVLRTYPLLDLFGGFAIATMIALGMLALRQDMDIQLLCYYGLSCFVNGVFDSVACMNRALDPDRYLFSSRNSMLVNLESAVIILSPWSSLLCSYMTWHLKKDYIVAVPGSTVANYLPALHPALQEHGRQQLAQHAQQLRMQQAESIPKENMFRGEGRKLGG